MRSDSEWSRATTTVTECPLATWLNREADYLLSTYLSHQRPLERGSLTDGFNTSTPSGRLLFHILASVAEMERELIKERTIAGLAAARAKGANRR